MHRLLFLFPVFLLILTMATSGSHADTRIGLEAFERGDYKTAAAEWKTLADQDDARAQYLLASMYAHGKGVPRNLGTALEWYQRSAELGFAKSQFLVGMAYREGKDLPQDYAAAFRLFQLAARQGDVDAQFFLASMFTNGDGTKKDHVRAYILFNIAMLQGHKEAKRGLDFVKGQLTPAQLETAKQQVENWKKNKS